jgi:hypothetical protein
VNGIGLSIRRNNHVEGEGIHHYQHGGGGHPPLQPHGGGEGIQAAQFGAGDIFSVPVGREVRRERERPTRKRGGSRTGVGGR